MSAAYVANVLETMKAVLDKLPSATYLDHLDDEKEELEAIRLGSVEIKEYVDTYYKVTYVVKPGQNVVSSVTTV